LIKTTREQRKRRRTINHRLTSWLASVIRENVPLKNNSETYMTKANTGKKEMHEENRNIGE
jgi:hypothetical protein